MYAVAKARITPLCAYVISGRVYVCVSAFLISSVCLTVITIYLAPVGTVSASFHLLLFFFLSDVLIIKLDRPVRREARNCFWYVMVNRDCYRFSITVVCTLTICWLGPRCELVFALIINWFIILVLVAKYLTNFFKM